MLCRVGKTTALALWATAEPGPVAWICLDDFDNRPGVFGPMPSRHCAGPALRWRARCQCHGPAPSPE
jgi:hypothetical protein